MGIELSFTKDHKTTITIPDTANLAEIKTALQTLIQNEVLRSYYITP